jgi:hypothetical protein
MSDIRPVPVSAGFGLMWIAFKGLSNLIFRNVTFRTQFTFGFGLTEPMLMPKLNKNDYSTDNYK